MIRRRTLLFIAVPFSLCIVGPQIGWSAGPDLIARELALEHRGEGEGVLAAGFGEPRALASADFDEDGVPDLVVGYAEPAGGILALYRGNIDALYSSTGEVRARRDPGQLADSPFLGPGLTRLLSIAPDFVAVGDFDADGHFDIVAIELGHDRLWWLPGDGRGGFAELRSYVLPGLVTAVASGEVNRRDGLSDLVVGISGSSGAQLLVLEGPQGALVALPEVVDLPAPARSLSLQQFDEDLYSDVVVAAGEDSVVVRGRDRQLSLGAERRDRAAEPLVERMGVDLAVLAKQRLPESVRRALGPDRNIRASRSMRLNRDAIEDHVVLVEGAANPWVLLSVPVATFTVDSTSDTADFDTGDGVCDTNDGNGDGPCTLRAAIEQANASAGTDAIEFSIGGAGPHTIQPSSTLPTITETVTIDGYSQAGASANTAPFPQSGNATLMIELDGSSASGSEGLKVQADDSVVRGLVVNRFNTGIRMTTAENVIIEGNFVGTDTTGTVDLGNTGTGVYFCGTPCGGPSTAGGLVGGSAPAARNLISGNNSRGIWVYGDPITVKGNFIGTDAAGTAGLGNGFGIFAQAGAVPVVGGAAAGEGNLISSHTSWGVILYGTTNAIVQGNRIGTDASGTLDITGSAIGVRVIAPSIDSLIGGTAGTTPWGGCTGACNLVSGNDTVGIEVGSGVDGTVIQGNFIGTDVTGTTAVGFSGRGIDVGDAFNTVIGGTVATARNVISGNRLGIQLWSNSGASLDSTVQGNFIGTDTSGLLALPNGVGADNNAGIFVFKATNNIIGGTEAGAGNLISGNNAHGVLIDGVQAQDNTLQGNSVGLALDGSALGNTGNGVTLLTSIFNADTPSNNLIGGIAAGEGNTIAYNTGDGVSLRSALGTGSGGVGNAIQTNSIFSNGGLGIDLDNDGVTANDSDDPDVGPNGLQNFPVLTAVSGTTVEGTLDSTASTLYRLEFFSSSTCDASGNGEGELFLGADSATTDSNGDVAFSAILTTSAAPGSFVTATATDPDGSTSELSLCFAIPPEFDFGDAPDPTYPTLVASNGARHILGSGLWLGSTVDSELDGQPTADADGDDLGGTDDEDGVAFTSGLGLGLSATVDVTASSAGLLDAWIDFDGDGDWLDTSEQIFTAEPLASGANALSYTAPLGAIVGMTFARFRVSSAAGLAPDGVADDGEVEDYEVGIVVGADVGITKVASADFAVPSMLLTYTLTVTNNGSLAATNVALVDTLPADVTFVSSDPSSPTCVEVSGTVSCDLGTMGVGVPVIVTIDVLVDTLVFENLTNTASASATELDPIAANNTATVITVVGLFYDGFESGDTSAWQ